MAAPPPEKPRTDYAPDGSHLKPNAVLWQDLQKRSLDELANFTLALPLSDQHLQFRFLDADIRVDIPNQRLMHDGGVGWAPLEDPLLELVALVYLNQVNAVFPLDRDIVGLQDLKESHFFVGPHELRTAGVLERYGSDPDGFKQAVMALEGQPVDMADAAGRPGDQGGVAVPQPIQPTAGHGHAPAEQAHTGRSPASQTVQAVGELPGTGLQVARKIEENGCP